MQSGRVICSPGDARCSSMKISQVVWHCGSDRRHGPFIRGLSLRKMTGFSGSRTAHSGLDFAEPGPITHPEKPCTQTRFSGFRALQFSPCRAYCESRIKHLYFNKNIKLGLG